MEDTKGPLSQQFGYDDPAILPLSEYSRDALEEAGDTWLKLTLQHYGPSATVQP